MTKFSIGQKVILTRRMQEHYKVMALAGIKGHYEGNIFLCTCVSRLAGAKIELYFDAGSFVSAKGSFGQWFKEHS